MPRKVDLELFPVQYKTKVRWGDMDAYGHLNNAAYFKLFEDVRILYMEKLGLSTSKRSDNRFGVVVATTQCKYRIPLKYPDEITVGARILSICDKKITMAYVVLIGADNQLAAEGDALLIGYDLEKQETSAFDSEVVRLVESFQPGLDSTL
jgi:acyl-CoA thioester hydrolase